MAQGFGILLLIAIPALELWGSTDTLKDFSIGVRATVELEPATISTAWGGPLDLEMDEAEGKSG
jgi:hypothetical protein